MVDHALLPSIADARLPAKYEAAKTALRECNRMDECKDWADKSAALASYAKQSQDKTLERTAMRIRARAIQRCGELLREVEKAQGGQPFHGSTTETDRPSRKKSATEAGLSEHEAKTALRVANVPEESFEEQVESDNPPTITALAEQGKQKPNGMPIYERMGITKEAFLAGIHVPGAMRGYLDRLNEYDPKQVAEGCDERKRLEVLENISRIEKFHHELIAKI